MRHDAEPIDEHLDERRPSGSRTTTTETVEDVIGPDAPMEATGHNLEAFGRPVRYAALQRDDMRRGWTLEPDAQGRYHALTLTLDEHGGWRVTADQPYDTLEAARAWSQRLFDEQEPSIPSR